MRVEWVPRVFLWAFSKSRIHRDGSIVAFATPCPGLDPGIGPACQIDRSRLVYLPRYVTRILRGLIAKLTRAEGDRVVLHTKQPTLSKPLKRGEKINLRRGHLEHDRIIGSRVRDAIQAHKGRPPLVQGLLGTTNSRQARKCD